MKQYALQLNLKIIAYCLMPNHYHFLIRQEGDQTAGLLPQRVFNSYSKAYNKRYLHSGTLFEDNYKVKPITESSHLLHLCRYIHGNPVKDRLVRDPADWPYSNYPEWIRLRKGTLFDLDFVRQNFTSTDDYRSFVLDGLRGRGETPKKIMTYLDGLG